MMEVMIASCEISDKLESQETQSGAHQKNGISFVQALYDKYVDQQQFEDRFKLPKDSAISTEITFVGFGEVTSVQKQLKGLVSIDLSGRNIRKAGDVSAIKGFLNKVKILNLAENRLSWKEVINIVLCLPNLREVILTANDLELVYGAHPGVTCALDSLVLGRIKLNWRDIVETLSKIWDHVGQIDLWDSQLTNESMMLSDEYLSPDSQRFVAMIKSLALGQNQFTNLEWLPRMGQIGNLLELDVSRCKLKTLGINNAIADTIRGLKVLNISYNDITSWQEVAQLNLLRNLESLICNDNPFFLTDKFARSQTTARIASLNKLNRETITSAFRRDSEIMYLRRVFHEYQVFLESRNEDFKLLHPRYEKLIEIYGIPDGVNIKPRNIEDKFVTVELCYDNRKIVKKVPRDMRISNLKMLCKALFKLRSPHGIDITCRVDDLSYPLDEDGQTLHFFSVENNYHLTIKLADS